MRSSFDREDTIKYVIADVDMPSQVSSTREEHYAGKMKARGDVDLYEISDQMLIMKG